MMQTSASHIGKNRFSSLDKRKGQMPIPLNLRTFLNREQMASLRQMEGFGWQLAFVRRSSDSEVIAVVVCSSSKQYGILELDGSINTDFDLIIRD